MIALCGYLPYGLKVHCKWSIPDEPNAVEDIGELVSVGLEKEEFLVKRKTLTTRFPNNRSGCSVKPYLRPMSSMTAKEKKEWVRLRVDVDKYIVGYEVVVDFYNRNRFDYRGLIVDGLAMEAPDGMYD